jgi:hypothetical protein
MKVRIKYIDGKYPIIAYGTYFVEISFFITGLRDMLHVILWPKVLATTQYNKETVVLKSIKFYFAF